MVLFVQECFDPIVDGISGGDLIPLMVYKYGFLPRVYYPYVSEEGPVFSIANEFLVAVDVDY